MLKNVTKTEHDRYRTPQRPFLFALMRYETALLPDAVYSCSDDSKRGLTIT